MAFTARLGTIDSTPGNIVLAFNTIQLVEVGAQVGSRFDALPYLTEIVLVGSVFSGSLAEPLAAGVQVGSILNLTPVLYEGVNVDSQFITPTNWPGVIATTVQIATVFTSDSGALASGRFRF